MKDNFKAFLTELVPLMEKHSITGIGWECGDDSDLHGVYDRRLEVYDNEDSARLCWHSDMVTRREIQDLLEE